MHVLAASADLRTAVIGAVGAIIGGVLTGTAAYLVERERSKREAVAHERQSREELRRAKRLLVDQLGQMLELLQWAGENSRYRREVAQALSRSVALWREFRGSLATTLDDPAWQATAEAFADATRLDVLIQQRLGDAPSAVAFDEDGISRAIERAGAARTSLTSGELPPAA